MEEIVLSKEATGHNLRTGSALFQRMVEAVRGSVDEVHLIVRRDNVHARDLYGRIGCSEVPWVLYEPLNSEIYMVAKVSDMVRALTRTWNAPIKWEMETGMSAAQLRDEDQTWVQQMYEEEHGGVRKWAQHHAHQAAHIVVWDGTGVGAAVGAARRQQTTARSIDDTAARPACTRRVDAAGECSGARCGMQLHDGQPQAAAPAAMVASTDARRHAASGDIDGPGSAAPGNNVEEPHDECDDGSGRGGDEREHAEDMSERNSSGKRGRDSDAGGGGGRSRCILRRRECHVGNSGDTTEAAGATYEDDGFAGEAYSEGNAEVEGMMEAEYMRGVKRKREGSDDTPPSPPPPPHPP